MNHFDKFSEDAKKALIFAEEISKESKSTYIGTEHILLGILSQKDSPGTNTLMHFGVSLDNVKLVLDSVGSINIQQENSSSEKLSRYAKKTLEDSVAIAYKFNHPIVTTQHILYAICLQRETAATVILENMKINLNDIIKNIEEEFKIGNTPGSLPLKSQPGTESPLPPSQNQEQGFNNPFEAFIGGLQGLLMGGNSSQQEDFADFYKGGTGKNADKQKKARSNIKTALMLTDIVELKKNRERVAVEIMKLAKNRHDDLLKGDKK